MNKRKYRLLTAVTFVWVLIAGLLIVSYAADSKSLSVSNMSGFLFVATSDNTFNDSNMYWNESGQQITGYAKGYNESCTDMARDTTLTITNDSGSDKQIKIVPVEIAVSGGSIVIKDSGDQQVANITSNTTDEYHLVDIAAGKAATVVLNSGVGSGSSVKFVFGVYDPSAADLNTTFTADGGGTITVNGTGNITSQTFPNAVGTAYDVTAVAATGNKFFAWYKTEAGGAESFVSYDATQKFTPEKDTTYRAKFLSATTPVFKVGSTMFTDLTAADNAATNGSNKTIVLVSDGTLPAGDYTISEGNTLLIPYNSANTLCTTSPTVTADAWVEPTAHKTLTMASGAHITVKGTGAISVSGTQTRAIVKKTNSAPTGPLGFIKMNDNSSITVNDGAFLYAWGYIHGSGNVTIKSGGTVYEDFQVADYRAGDATTQMTSGDNVSTYHVFPFSQYYAQNVQVPMTLEAGAIENTHFAVTVSSMELTTTVSFVGPNGMFQITNGHIIKDYDEAEDRLHLEICGDFQIKPTTITIEAPSWAGILGIKDTVIQSANYYFPIHGGLQVDICSGTTTVSQDMVVHPGAIFNIAAGATVSVTENKSIVVYDLDDWAKDATAAGGSYTGTGFVYHEASGYTNYQLVPVYYAVGRQKIRAVSDLADAKICVGGTLDASNGYLYTTSGGANIYGEENGQVVTRAGTLTTNYQVWQYDTNLSYQSIGIASAKLQNADGTNVQSGTNTYTYINGFWCCPAVTDANNDHKCETCGSPAVAQIGSAKYHSLENAVANYSTGYIQMLSDTSESTVDVKKPICLDLSGHTIAELIVGSGGVLNGMDTTTNAFGIDGSTGGSISTLTVNGGTVNEVYQYEQDGTSGKKYIAYTDKNGAVSFHRFDLGISEYTFYGYTNADGTPTGAMTFTAAFKGDEKALLAMKDKGFQIKNSQAFASETHNETTATLEDYAVNGKTIGCTLTGTLSGFDLDDGPTFTESFAAYALIQAAKIGQTGNAVYSNADFTDSEVHSGTISFQDACQIAYDAYIEGGNTDKANEIAAFAKGKFDLTTQE